MICTTDTQWRHKSKKSENLGRCGRQNMLPPYLKIWDWELIFGRAVKAISSPGVGSPWSVPKKSSRYSYAKIVLEYIFFWLVNQVFEYPDQKDKSWRDSTKFKGKILQTWHWKSDNIQCISNSKFIYHISLNNVPPWIMSPLE